MVVSVGVFLVLVVVVVVVVAGAAAGVVGSDSRSCCFLVRCDFALVPAYDFINLW